MIKNVIFDVGKVLVDYYPNQFMEGIGLSEEERAAVNAAMFDNPLWIKGDEGAYPSEDFIGLFVAEDPAHEEAIRKAYDNLGTIISPYDYVVPWMEELKGKGCELFVLSNYPEFLYEKTNPRMVFLPYMKDCIFSAMVKLVKPDPRIYELLLARNGLVPEECVFIDDRLENVEGARAVGIHGIHFTSYEEARRSVLELIEC